MSQTPFNDMLDAAVASDAAVNLKGSNAGAMRGIFMAAMLVHVKGNNPGTRGVLFNAFMSADFAENTAKNYVSRAVTAAKPDFFKWKIDRAMPLEDIVDDLLPEFIVFWGGDERPGTINDIRAKGPRTAAEVAADKAKAANAKADKETAAAKLAADAPEAPVTMEAATPRMLMHAFVASLDSPDLTAEDLQSVIDAINTEVLTRMTEPEMQIAA
jgi:hypothetical protein